MTRTFRDRGCRIFEKDSDVEYHRCVLEKSDKEMNHTIVRHYGDGKSGHWNLPKHFRKMVEKKRRSRNKQEVHRAYKDTEYIPNLSPCNGRDARVLDWF